jgi:hypothetical protein
MKYSTEEIYNDDELDFGYESEAMIIEPEEYIRFPLPKGKEEEKKIPINRNLRFFFFSSC